MVTFKRKEEMKQGKWVRVTVTAIQYQCKDVNKKDGVSKGERDGNGEPGLKETPKKGYRPGWTIR